MNTNDLEDMERYHEGMAKILESHVVHHKERAASFRARRKKLKTALVKQKSKTITALILEKLVGQK